MAGEVSEFPDPHSFVLETGGLLNDEIAVIVPPKSARGLQTYQLRDDDDVVVSGTVRAATVVDLQRELSWDLDPELTAEFEGVRYFIVADRITKQRR